MREVVMRTKALSVLLALVVFVISSVAQAPKRADRSPSAAVWNSDLEGWIGISKVQFEEMGLARLTPDQATTLFTFISSRSQSERVEGEKEVLSYNCAAPEIDGKVRVYIGGSDKSSEVVLSSLRQILRSMTDVEIVYDQKTADVTASVLVMEAESQNGRPIGFTASLVLTSSCEAQFLGQKWPLEIILPITSIPTRIPRDWRRLFRRLSILRDSRGSESCNQRSAPLERNSISGPMI